MHGCLDLGGRIGEVGPDPCGSPGVVVMSLLLLEFFWGSKIIQKLI